MASIILSFIFLILAFSPILLFIGIGLWVNFKKEKSKSKAKLKSKEKPFKPHKIIIRENENYYLKWNGKSYEKFNAKGEVVAYYCDFHCSKKLLPLKDIYKSDEYCYYTENEELVRKAIEYKMKYDYEFYQYKLQEFRKELEHKFESKCGFSFEEFEKEFPELLF